MTQKHPSTYVLMNADGNPWGPFDKATAAAEWATNKWPEQSEAVGDERGNLSEGWTVWTLRHPDEPR